MRTPERADAGLADFNEILTFTLPDSFGRKLILDPDDFAIEAVEGDYGRVDGAEEADLRGAVGIATEPTDGSTLLFDPCFHSPNCKGTDREDDTHTKT